MNYQSVVSTLDFYQCQLLELFHQSPNRYNPDDWQQLQTIAMESCQIYQPYRACPLIQRHVVLDMLLCLRHLLVLPEMKHIPWGSLSSLRHFSGSGEINDLIRQLEATERQIYHARLPEIAVQRDKLMAMVDAIRWLTGEISAYSESNIPPLYPLKNVFFKMAAYWYFDATGEPFETPGFAELQEEFQQGSCRLILKFADGEFQANLRFEPSENLSFSFQEFMLGVAPVRYRHAQAIWISEGDIARGHWFQLSSRQEEDLKVTLVGIFNNKTIQYYIERYSQYYGYY